MKNLDPMTKIRFRSFADYVLTHYVWTTW